MGVDKWEWEVGGGEWEVRQEEQEIGRGKRDWTWGTWIKIGIRWGGIWIGNEIGRRKRGWIGGSTGREWGQMWGIKEGARSFGSTFCSNAPRLPASNEKYEHAGCTKRREPFEGHNFRKRIIILNGITTIFTIFLAILEKPRLVDLLVKLINKLYPMQYYFEVYAWMFL